jgi:acyl transferase domain-containing protein
VNGNVHQKELNGIFITVLPRTLPITEAGTVNGLTSSPAGGEKVSINGHGGGNAVNGEAKENPFRPIAICGMACRLPGNIASPKEMWDFIVAGNDAHSEVPATRWSTKAWYSATKKKGTSRTKHGYFLDESVDLGALDAAAFPMPRGEIERMDPQQRLLLEVAHECLDDSGEINWKGSLTGVYIGCFGQDWYDLQTRETLKYSNYQITGSHDFMVSERISHELDLHGPWYV